MRNRIAFSYASEQVLLRKLSNQVNAVSSTCGTMTLDRFCNRSTETSVRFHFHQLDNVTVVMDCNKYKAPEQNALKPNIGLGVHGKRASVPEWKKNLEKAFRSYADKWYAETRRESSLTKITSNINYLKVIELGRPAVPLILKELQSNPAPWFLVLRVLTQNTEIGRGYPGNFEKMAEAWIKWGKERALIK